MSKRFESSVEKTKSSVFIFNQEEAYVGTSLSQVYEVFHDSLPIVPNRDIVKITLVETRVQNLKFKTEAETEVKNSQRVALLIIFAAVQEFLTKKKVCALLVT